MKTATPELIAFLQSARQLCMVDLYTFETLSGTSYYTDHDQNKTVNSILYRADGPIIERDGTRLVRGTEVDTMEINITALEDDTIEGLPFIAGALQGALDDARISVTRAFYEDWNGPLKGTVKIFDGRVSTVDGDRYNVKLTVVSDLELLNVKLPRTLYQSPCVYTVYGPGCGVQRSGFQVSSSASVGSTTSQLVTALGQAAGWFDQGVLVFTSGANNGVRRTVKSFAGGLFNFALPLAHAPASGDTFIVSPGCDHTDTACGPAKFNNKARNRSYPYVPAPETPY